MLDLAVPVRTVEGIDLAQDGGDPLTFYALPPPPRVARTGGRAEIDLLRFVSGAGMTGGHLRLAVALAQDPARLARATESLADEHRVAPTAITLRPLPVQRASAEILFVGRETTPDGGLTGVVRRGFGAVPAQSIDPYTAMFSIGLEPAGVALVEAAMRAGAAPVGINYRLEIEALRPAHRVLAQVDWRRVYDHFSGHAREGALLAVEDVQGIRESLVEDRVIRIDAVHGLTEDGGTAEDFSGIVAWIDREIVERFCEPVLPLSRQPARASLGTFGDIMGVGSSYAVKRLTQIERATATIDLQRVAVVARTLAVQAHLADLLDGDAADGHVLDAGADHPFFARMTLAVRAAQPLADVHASDVMLTFAYGQTSETARLTADAPDAQFETWADQAPDRTWHLRPEVTFGSDAPLDPGARVLVPEIAGQSRALTLDFEDLLGLVRFDVSAPSDARVLLSRATVTRHRAGEPSLDRDAAMAPGVQAQTVWFRDRRPADRFTVTPEYLLADGRRISVPPFPADTRVVRLPPAFPGSMTVQLIADEDWGDLQKVVVSVQKQADGATGVFTFDHGGQSVALALDMPDPADRRFRYRMTRMLASGAVEEDEWIETDVPVVLVGRTAANRLSVAIEPVGPELPVAGVVLVEVDVSYIDAPHQVRDIRKFVIRALSDRYRWDVTLADPARRDYQYRITVHRTSGAEQVGPWTRSTDRMLVVPITAA